MPVIIGFCAASVQAKPKSDSSCKRQLVSSLAVPAISQKLQMPSGTPIPYACFRKTANSFDRSKTHSWPRMNNTYSILAVLAILTKFEILICALANLLRFQRSLARDQRLDVSASKDGDW